MSQRVRVGNTYHHKTRDEEVIVTHHDHQNDVWFRGVKSRDNAGVISTTDWIEQQPYREFLGCVSMRDYPEDWQQKRAAVFKRDQYTCQGCGVSDVEADELHCHHIVPLGAGGTNVRSNLITLCDECHGRVHGGVT